MDEALAASGPVIVEAVVDPYEPPMPPEVSLDQAFELGKALVRGQPEGGRIMKTIFENQVKEML